MTFLGRFKKKREVERKEREKVETPETPKPAPGQAPARHAEPALVIGLEPHRSEKATALEKEGTYVFRVRRGVSKSQVRRAVEKMFAVKVEDVRVANLPSKRRRRGRTLGQRPGLRKALVTLRKGDRIELGV